MTLEQAEQIVEWIEDNVYSVDIELYENYSGRGMYGNAVPGFVTDSPEVVTYACGVLGIPWNETPQRTDSMGMSRIIY